MVRLLKNTSHQFSALYSLASSMILRHILSPWSACLVSRLSCVDSLRKTTTRCCTYAMYIVKFLHKPTNCGWSKSENEQKKKTYSKRIIVSTFDFMSVVLCFVSLLRKSFSFSSLNFILAARINQSDVRAIHVSRELLIRGDRGCVSNVEISYGVLMFSSPRKKWC